MGWGGMAGEVGKNITQKHQKTGNKLSGTADPLKYSKPDNCKVF